MSRDFTQARSTYHVHHSPRTPRGQPYGDLRMTGVLIKGAVPSVDSGWMVLPQSLRSGVFTFEEIATAPWQWCWKDRPNTETGRLRSGGATAVSVRRRPDGHVTAPPGIGRACTRSSTFTRGAGTSSPQPGELSFKRKRKESVKKSPVHSTV